VTPARTIASSPRPDQRVFIVEHPRTQLAEHGEPGARVPEILVIAGNEERTVGAAQFRQGRDLGREIRRMAVGEIAGQGNEVGFGGR